MQSCLAATQLHTKASGCLRSALHDSAQAIAARRAQLPLNMNPGPHPHVYMFNAQALKDFRDRIAKYEEVYETITDRNMHYIKLIDM